VLLSVVTVRPTARKTQADLWATNFAVLRTIVALEPADAEESARTASR